MRYLLLAAIVIAGCSYASPTTPPGVKTSTPAQTTVKIKPGPNVQDELLTALIKAKAGTVIELAEGTYDFTGSLSLMASGVTIRGAGMAKTILSFKKQDQGKEGIKVENANDMLIENLTVQDTKGDAIKVQNGTNVTFKKVRTIWSDGPKESNGGYGLYPVTCTNVLVEECDAQCASDAGIYVGQSKNVIVRKCTASRNVAGIEIENCTHAEVTECVATNNSGGILVFDMPNLPAKNGKMVRVFKNVTEGNNHKNFAPKGNIVATVPPGTGMMVLAMDQVELFDNQIKNNQTSGLCIISFQLAAKEITDKEYDPYPEGVYVHDNVFTDNGKNPAGELGLILGSALGKPLPDIIYDGNVDPKKMVNGKTPENLSLRMNNNGKATFINLHYDGSPLMKYAMSNPKFEKSTAEFEGKLPSIPPVQMK
ncbi:MAG: parallel beta-helix domain-containing protein [Gemmatales bacterium]